jgi:hypothetical protein
MRKMGLLPYEMVVSMHLSFRGESKKVGNTPLFMTVNDYLPFTLHTKSNRTHFKIRNAEIRKPNIHNMPYNQAVAWKNNSWFLFSISFIFGSIAKYTRF